MKLNRIKLRQLIIEVLVEGSHKYVAKSGISGEDDEVYTMDQTHVAKLTGRTLDAMSKGKHPNLGALKASDPDYASKLASDAGYQPETTTIERGAQNIPDSEFTKPDSPLQDYSQGKSIEFTKYLKKECKKRGYTCTVKDERNFDPEDPFLAVSVMDDNAIERKKLYGESEYGIDASIHLSDDGEGIFIEIFDNRVDASPFSFNDASIGFGEAETAPYFKQLGGLDELAKRILDSTAY